MFPFFHMCPPHGEIVLKLRDIILLHAMLHLNFSDFALFFEIISENTVAILFFKSIFQAYGNHSMI